MKRMPAASTILIRPFTPEVTRHLTYNLIMHHPATIPADFIYIEDTATNAIVSSLCLIPWVWRYGEVQLRAGEMGIVGTTPAYRRHGLSRILTDQFKHMLRERQFHVSHNPGYPHFLSPVWL